MYYDIEEAICVHVRDMIDIEIHKLVSTPEAQATIQEEAERRIQSHINQLCTNVETLISERNYYKNMYEALLFERALNEGEK